MKQAVRAPLGRLGRCIAALAAAAIALVVLFGSSAAAAGAGAERDGKVKLAQSEPAGHKQPAIILGPPPEEEKPSDIAPDVEAQEPAGDPPPIARRKPDPPKKASAPEPPRKQAPAKAATKKPAKKATTKTAPAKKAPVRAVVSPPQQEAKDCDYCYGCESLSHACRRQWVCGKMYRDRLAAGLCRR